MRIVSWQAKDMGQLAVPTAARPASVTQAAAARWAAEATVPTPSPMTEGSSEKSQQREFGIPQLRLSRSGHGSRKRLC